MEVSIFLLMLMFSSYPVVVDAFHERMVRCRVCQRSISHIWSRATNLRRKCKHIDHTDERCDFKNVHPWAIDQMVWGVCDALPQTYQALHYDGEFDLILHEEPNHSEELAALIRATCKKFLHEHHGVDDIGRVMLANLEVGKTTEVILKSLEKHFCSKPCSRHWEDGDDEF